MNGDNVGKVVGTFVMFLVFLVLAIVFPISNAMGPEYQYEDAVGSHFKNAEQATTPELFVAEINLAIIGTEDLGLTPQTTARAFAWEQTPNHEMSWLLSWLDSLVDRAWAVAEWRNVTYGNDITTEILDDVYQDKMDSITDLLNPTYAPTWIAHDAFILHYHPLYYWFILVWCVLAIICMGFGVWCWCLSAADY